MPACSRVCVVQSLADRLLSTQVSQADMRSPHADSLGDIGPRLQTAEVLRKVSAGISSLHIACRESSGSMIDSAAMLGSSTASH